MTLVISRTRHPRLAPSPCLFGGPMTLVISPGHGPFCLAIYTCHISAFAMPQPCHLGSSDSRRWSCSGYHLRTTDPIESTFSTVRLRSRVTRGAGSRTAGLAMTFKLLEAASGHWRKLNGRQLLPLVRAGVKFIDWKQQERKLKLINTQPEMKPARRAAA